MPAPEIGQPAPDVTLLGAENKERSLSEFRGRNVVLFFFPKSFTGTCERQISEHARRIDQFTRLNAAVVGVSTDQVPAQLAFAKQCNPDGSVVLLSDFRRKAIEQYGVAVEEGALPNQRATFIIDKGGILRYKHVEPAPGQWQGIEPELVQLEQLQ
jgi:peroxiredoxin